MKPPPVNDSDRYDGPASFAEAGEAFAEWSRNRLSAYWAAELLSRLAQAGLIVSVELHEEVAGGYAAELSAAHGAADDLVRRLAEGGDL